MTIPVSVMGPSTSPVTFERQLTRVLGDVLTSGERCGRYEIGNDIWREAIPTILSNRVEEYGNCKPGEGLYPDSRLDAAACNNTICHVKIALDLCNRHVIDPAHPEVFVRAAIGAAVQDFVGVVENTEPILNGIRLALEGTNEQLLSEHGKAAFDEAEAIVNLNLVNPKCVQVV